MSFSTISALTGAIALVSQVAAHGTVTGIVADGVYYEGYHASFQYLQTQPAVVGWSIPKDLSNGFIAPDVYTTSDIICHLGATNAQTSATVAAGGQVELQWTAWPSSHHGPVIDYLANCNGDCKTVDKTTLEFFKIDGVGLIDDTTVPGTWASDTLIANNNSWTVTIPSDIAPGNYVLRHEIIALHSAGTVDGAQNYPQCVNLEVTGSGTATPSGVLGTALYVETDPGIEVNIYTSLSAYVVPGPTLYSGAIIAKQTGGEVITGVAPIATGGASATAVTPVASSAPNEVASSSTAQITYVASVASASGGLVGMQPSGATYVNSTSTKKSACKSKSSKTTATAATTPEVVAVSTSSGLPFATPATIPTSYSADSTSTSSLAVTAPAGTTLSDLLSWISSFYNKFKGASYDGNTVARRHARDVARAGMEKFDRAGGFAAGATGSGFPHPTGHHHHHGTGFPHGTGFAKPTGTFASGFVAPTAGRHFAAAEFGP